MSPPPDTIANVELTAFYCCAQRERDAGEADPLCGDRHASRFLDDGLRERLAPLLGNAAVRASDVARHRIIDDRVRDALAGDPGRRVLIVGAGLDTRAFRLTGGRWFEFDHPSILAIKERELPGRAAPNPLMRIAYDHRRDALADTLAQHAGDDDAIVVLEGVSAYLDHDALGALAGTVRAALPRARLIADLSTAAFRRIFSHRFAAQLAGLGVPFALGDRHPREAFESAGWRAIATASIADRVRIWRPDLLPRLRSQQAERMQREGYAIWTFEPGT
jgi:methyltransferase (TIGR00027 family)